MVIFMFKDYKIIEKTLILYIDYDSEFGIDFNLHHRYSNMKNEIKKIIKKINFDGEKVALSVGGIVLATLLVVKTPSTNKPNLVYVNSNIVPNTDISLVIENKEEEIVEDVVNDNISLEEDKKEDIKTTVIEEAKKEKNTLKEVKQEIKEETNKEEVKTEVKEENNSSTKVTIYRKNGSIITLDLEDYLVGVVGAEMPAAFNIEALKAQAVIARTYTLRSIEKGRKLTDTVSTQSYNDNNELKDKWGSDFNKYYEKVRQAVNSTKDVAIYYDNNYIDAVYHSTSNGKTEDSKYVWGNDIPYLKSVDSSWDINTTSYLRTVDKDINNVLTILGVDTSDFTILSKDESGRVLEISVGDKVFSGVEFRNLLGLRSADFDINIENNNISITTRGYGHGVGLSQYGANEMAKLGFNYKDIIKHYYTGVEVK